MSIEDVSRDITEGRQQLRAADLDGARGRVEQLSLESVASAIGTAHLILYSDVR